MAKIHLLVLIHGMWGNPSHLAELERIVRETYPKPTDGIQLLVLTAQSVRDESTYDGADWGGERVAQEVIEKAASLEKSGDQVVRFSVTGYSLGGLIARYCIGVLQQRGFFDNVEPLNFNTFATPHCGLPSYQTLFSSLSRGLGPTLMSRTAEQFYCLDKWSPKGCPLLVAMADPERVFYQTLAKFKHIRIYANAVNDLTVPYVTSAIETIDPFVEEDISSVEIALQEKHPCLIQAYSIPDVAPSKTAKPIILSPQWFKRLQPTRTLLPLPLFLQFRFPLNIIFYSALPLLIPMFLALILVHLAISSRSSRTTVQILENGLNERQTKRLVHVLSEIEREMEDATVDLFDNVDPPPYHPAEKNRAHPIISPTHIKIANWLNTLPIQKELTFFPEVRNSHATIICQDVNTFETQRQGEPALRHWANAFVL